MYVIKPTERRECGGITWWVHFQGGWPWGRWVISGLECPIPSISFSTFDLLSGQSHHLSQAGWVSVSHMSTMGASSTMQMQSISGRKMSPPIKAILSLPFEGDTATLQSPACKLGPVFPAAERDLSCSIYSWLCVAASARPVRHPAKVKKAIYDLETGTQQTGWGRQRHWAIQVHPTPEARQRWEGERTLGGNVIYICFIVKFSKTFILITASFLQLSSRAPILLLNNRLSTVFGKNVRLNEE